MLVEYTIALKDGALLITQRVEPGTAISKASASSIQGEVTTLPSTYAKFQAAQSTGAKRALAGGGDGESGGKIGGGDGESGGKIGGGDGESGGKIGGGGLEAGQVFVFGPLLIDACGLLSKHGAATIITPTHEKSTDK